MKATVPLQHKTSQTAVISSASKATSNPLQFKNVVEEVPLQILQNPLAAVNYHQNPLQLFSETPAQPNSRNPLQLIARQATGRQSKGGNNTGLPDNLKAGVESLSGYSMDDVRVHYNSDEPTQLQALAYTQGTDIHIAPGQEKHLPHET